MGSPTPTTSAPLSAVLGPWCPWASAALTPQRWPDRIGGQGGGGALEHLPVARVVNLNRSLEN